MNQKLVCWVVPFFISSICEHIRSQNQTSWDILASLSSTTYAIMKLSLHSKIHCEILSPELAQSKRTYSFIIELCALRIRIPFKNICYSEIQKPLHAFEISFIWKYLIHISWLSVPSKFKLDARIAINSCSSAFCCILTFQIRWKCKCSHSNLCIGLSCLQHGCSASRISVNNNYFFW